MLSNIDIMPASRLAVPFTSGGRSRSGKRICVHHNETLFSFAGWSFSIWRPHGAEDDQPVCTVVARGPIVGAYQLEGVGFHQGLRRANLFALYHDPKTGLRRTPPDRIEESMFGVRFLLRREGDWYVVETSGRPDIFKVGEPSFRFRRTA